MSEKEEFVIDDGCLKAYNGNKNRVSIPAGVTVIGKRCFANKNLVSLDIPEGVTEIGEEAFFGCNALETVNLPEGLVKIDDWAFGFCDTLKSVCLPESLTILNSFSFYGCETLSCLYLPENLMWPCHGCFGKCPHLNALTVSPKNPNMEQQGPLIIRKSNDFLAIMFCKKDIKGTIRIPDSISGIDSYAFEYCTDLTDVIASKDVQFVGINAFHECSSMKSILFTHGPLFLSQDAFCDCALEQITFPEKEDVILCGLTFHNCKNLSCVVLPESVTCIEESLFEGCDKLKKLSLPASLKAVKKNAFKDCWHLEELDFPESMQSLDETVLENCEVERLIFRGMIPDLDLNSCGYAVVENGELYVDWYPFNRLSMRNQRKVARGVARRIQEGIQVPEEVLWDVIPYLSENCLSLWRDPFYRPVLLKRGMLSLEHYMQILEQTLKDGEDPTLNAQLLEYQHRNFSQEEIDEINRKMYNLA